MENMMDFVKKKTKRILKICLNIIIVEIPI